MQPAQSGRPESTTQPAVHIRHEGDCVKKKKPTYLDRTVYLELDFYYIEDFYYLSRF